MNNITKYKLYQCRTVEPFRVAEGKSSWHWYNPEMLFQQEWNLRQILSSEIITEFDTEDVDLAWEAINFTAINLTKAGIEFEVWDHGGKSPHLHIRNLPIAHLEKDKLRLFKKLFIKKYVPGEYLDIVDNSLTGIHLVAIEGVEHWKGCYDVKMLVHKFKKDILNDSNNIWLL